MNSLCKSLVRTLCLGVILAGAIAPAGAADLLPLRLRELAANSTSPSSWPLLRTYAQSQTDREWRGWAYFLAGYQEYEAEQYSDAAHDLARASESDFALADYALYYQAQALSQGNQAQQAAAALADLAARFPHSHLHLRAVTLRANALLAAQQTQQAIDLLSAEPGTLKQPALALLLGQANVQLHHAMEAVAAFQDVYYRFPLSTQAKAADDALKELREQLGSAYPAPHVELLMARADALYKGTRYDDALKVYSDLQRDEPASPFVPQWQLSQARCLLRLHRSADALQVLATHFTPPDLDAQRLFVLVQVHAQQSNTQGMSQDLAQLEASYAGSPAYADALAAAGIFYYRQLNWQEAAHNYQRLSELFPHNDHVREDGWRLAWCDYILGDPKTAEAMRQFLKAFPDSPRAGAALYWLGRVEEQDGSLADARALYTLLTKQYAHTYYALQAAARLAGIHTPGKTEGGNASDAAPLAAELTQVLTPPAVPRGLACLAYSPTDAARPALILQAFNLKGVEEDFLHGALSESHPPPELRLLMVRLSAAQHDTATALFGATRIAPAYPQMEFSDLPKEIWNFLYPRAYWQLVQRQARLNKLSPYLVMGLMRQESAFDPHALSVANARGLMQLLPETAAHSTRRSRTRAAARRLNDPSYNVRSGCAYLAWLMKAFDGKPEYAMAAYNAGDFRVRDWQGKYTFHDSVTFLESIPIPATRGYVEAVLRDADVYRQLLSTTPPRFAVCSAAPASTPTHHPSTTHRTTRPTPHATPKSPQAPAH